MVVQNLETDLEKAWKHRKKKDGGDYMVVVMVSLLSYVWMWELDHKEGWVPKNGGAGEHSWESLGQQGDQTSQS